MPMYEYRCRRCGAKYEQLRRIAEADRDLKCPYCQAEEVERLLSAFSTGGGCAPSSGFS